MKIANNENRVAYTTRLLTIFTAILCLGRDATSIVDAASQLEIVAAHGPCVDVEPHLFRICTASLERTRNQAARNSLGVSPPHR